MLSSVVAPPVIVEVLADSMPFRKDILATDPRDGIIIDDLAEPDCPRKTGEDGADFIVNVGVFGIDRL